MAKRYSEHRALNIFSFEAEKWEYPLHKHNFFELIFIEKGSGLHIVNGITASYRPHSCFLMTPDDESLQRSYCRNVPMLSGKSE